MIDKFKYTKEEVGELIESMTILVDTREKVNSHILSYFDGAKIPYKKKKLDYGDYSFYVPKNDKLNIPRDLYFDQEIMIERKASLDEIAGNFQKDRAGKEKEFALAPERKLLLIENAGYEDVIRGNYRSKYSNRSMWATLHTFQHRYNMQLIFIPDKRFTGYYIQGYFTYYLREFIRTDK